MNDINCHPATIPGRPPLHERSTSAPGNSWRHHMYAESMLSCLSGPVLDEKAELALSSGGNTPSTQTANSSKETLVNQPNKQRSASPKQPLSPKSLAPLVIPSCQSNILIHQSSNCRLRSSDPPPEVPPKSARMKEGSPYPRASPFTPMSSTTTLALASTPQSAPEGRSSPKPWPTPTTATGPSPMGHLRGQSDSPSSITQHRQTLHCHRRGESEGSTSVMDRGRPKRRADTHPSPLKQTPRKRSPSTEEQKAFETLPAGVKATEAAGILSPTEVSILRKQAIGQASRFEVLSSKNVESLSRELRGLDERCDYLRKTHRSLRSGRRNLHDRICNYLRSPRVARFSHESILKQEEALSELDSSIDDWVSKLEQAENRRTRVRQKLLEHVAAALIMQPSTPNEQKNISVAPSGENTPPRSPTKREGISPHREMERVVEEVRVASPEMMTRGGRDVASLASLQSIKIYADSDVYALLADVEEEITRMGEQSEADAKERLEIEKAEKEKEKEAEQKKEDAVNAGVMLSAIAFAGLPGRRTPPTGRSTPGPYGMPQYV
jgi:hypothetical protein